MTHERITAQIVDELMDYGAAHYKAMVPDPRVFFKVAKKTKKAMPGSTRLTFLETYIYQVLEVSKLPKV
jgi:hypothetical protein